MANETTPEVTHTPIQLGSLGITLNSPADLNAQTVAALEARLSPEFKQKAIEIEKLASTFQSLAADLPPDVSLSQAYARLKALGGKIDDSAEPWLKEFARKSRDIPVLGGLTSTADNIHTLDTMFSGAVNTAYDGLMFLPRLAGASAGKVGEFFDSFDPTLDGEQAKAFAVLYASLQQDAMVTHDNLPMMTMPFDGKDSKVESSPVEYIMATIKHWGSKLAGFPVIREAIAGVMAACQYGLQFLNKEQHERLGFAQLYAANVTMLNNNAAGIGSVEDLARESIVTAQSTQAAGQLVGFFGKDSLVGELAAAVAQNAPVRTSDGLQQVQDGQVTPLNDEKPGFVHQVTGNLGQTLSTPGGAIGAAGAVALGLHQKDNIARVGGRILTGAVDLAKGTGRLATNTVAGTVKMGASALGGTAAGLSDGLARPFGMSRFMGDLATQPTTAAASTVRAGTNTVVQGIESGAARLTGAALAEAPAASAVASRTFRATQLGSKVIGRAAAPLAIGTAAWDVVKGIEAYQAGDTEEATRRGTSVGMVGTGAAAGAGIGVWFFGAGAAPGALIGAGVGGIVDYFVGDDVADALIGDDGKPVQTAEQQAQNDALAHAARDAEMRAAQARQQAVQAAGQLQINKPVAHIGAVGGEGNLRPTDAPSSADVQRSLFGVPTRN